MDALDSYLDMQLKLTIECLLLSIDLLIVIKKEEFSKTFLFILLF